MGKITLYNRDTKQLEEEAVFGQTFMNLFYGNEIGLFISDKILKLPFISQNYGNYFKKSITKKKINSFIKQFNIDIEQIVDPVSSYQSFNDFFIRKLKKSARPFTKDKDVLISPADSRLLIYDITDEVVLPIKGKSFTLFELLRDEYLAEKYENGLCLVFRLAPVDYHRFCYIDNGKLDYIIQVGKYFHSVNPLPLSKNLRVFEENYREICMMKTENFDEVIHIDVGALGVSKIVQNHSSGYKFKKGEEKGYFEFGGSTSILLIKKDIVKIDDDILEYSKKGIETLVKYGSSIGKKIT